MYSSWQLLTLRQALSRYEFARLGFVQPNGRPLADQQRLVRVLCALSTRYLPGVLGQVSMPPDADELDLRRYRASTNTLDLLTQASFAPVRLAETADGLLAQAHDDPLRDWLPLIRYAGYRQGWSKLRGRSLENMWRRVAAEILLQAHEDLTADGHLAPLPDLTGAACWSAARPVDAPSRGRRILGARPC